MNTQGPKLEYAIALCISAFTLLASYALARPAVESLFLEHHGSDALPYAWLLVGIAVVAVVSVYNRFSSSLPLPRVYGAAVAASSSVLALLLFSPQSDLSMMFLYVWKDVYIVVLIEIFWTVANTYYDRKTAPWIYGLFLMMGSLGGMAGNFGVGHIAEWVGSENLLWGVIPLTLISWLMLLPFGSVTRTASGTNQAT